MKNIEIKENFYCKDFHKEFKRTYHNDIYDGFSKYILTIELDVTGDYDHHFYLTEDSDGENDRICIGMEEQNYIGRAILKSVNKIN